MTARSLALSIFAAAVSALCAGEPSTLPFASVVRDGDVIVATLPTIGIRYLIAENIKSTRPRVTEYGQSFRLHAGESLEFVTHHGRYQISCQFSPAPAGL